MSPTPIGRCPRHRSVGVGDIDLEAVKAHQMQKCLMPSAAPPSEDKRGVLDPTEASMMRF
ncbi:MAG: hypothetical protein K2H04_10685 [Bacteroidaceae bacterium]|nr:hypothetical protein [Bacteroidaceae bacterium]